MTRRFALFASLCVLLAVPLHRAIAQDDDPRVTPVVRAVRRAAPAVVNISTTKVIRARSNFLGRDIFDEIFPGRSLPQRQLNVHNLGSGVVIRPDGYIVTNAHVVRQAQTIEVTFADSETRHRARVVVADAQADLAILKINPPDGNPLPYLPLGRADDLMPGETVIAIGNPLGLASTVTVGVVSATGRELDFGDGLAFRDLIQTDAPINQGNSGGPLLNIKGELIGITTAIKPEAQSIGFAISVDTLRSLLPEMLNIEKLSRVIFGATVRQKPLDRGGEVLVTAVRNGTPAAGVLQPGDHLLKINASEIRHITHYVFAMLDLKPGDDLAITVRRDGQVKTVGMKLRARPAPNGKALAGSKLGLGLRAITPALARDLNLPVRNGLLIVEVAPGSPAAEVGIRPGDVLFQVAGFTVADFDALTPVLDDLPAEARTTIGILRGNTAVLIRLRLARTSPSTRLAP
jgi:serine protease Do